MKQKIKAFSEKNNIELHKCDWFAYDIASSIFDEITRIKPSFRAVGNQSDISIKKILLFKIKMLEDLTKNAGI